MKLSRINTRFIVIIGYCLLLSLAIIGIVTVYLELVKSSRKSKDSAEFKKELINLSNTLATMYEAEGTASLLAYAENEHLKLEYDSLSYRIMNQIDSLRLISTNTDINSSLDSLSALMMRKRINALEMFQFIKQIDKNIIEEITKRQVITRTDVDKLNTILAGVTTAKQDTVVAIAEKKGFFKRLANVLKSSNDTVTQISKGSTSETKELAAPILITDTIVEFFQQFNKQAQTKNAKIIQQVIARQRELYIIKEQTVFHINRIMATMEEREYQTSMAYLKEKNDSLRGSTRFVAIVGLTALGVAVFFMSWILKSLNESRRLQKNIREARKRAETLLKSREQLIYTITHDIKAPLSSIIGFLDLIKRDTLSQKQKYYVDNMHSSATHILDLVRNLLDFHLIEKEQFQLTSVAFSPASFVRDVYQSFLPLTQKKKQVFKLHSTLPEAKTFTSDPYYIRQIMNNLLSNAVKFTPDEGHISLITAIEEPDCWKISVKDDGPGVDVEDQKKIFEEYIRLDKTKKELEGSGLGLPISKKFATQLGGTIEIESQKGKGSIFTLSIPLTPVSENSLPAPDKNVQVSSVRVLFVDDDQIQLNLLSEWMKREGLPCVCCSRAYEALKVLQNESFNIVFTDIHIPDMEGFELIKRIRELDIPNAATIPVIAFSASFLKSEPLFRAAGFNEFLNKPCKIHQLMEIIERYTPFRRKPDEMHHDDDSGWRNIIDFVSDDQEAAKKIIDSFMDETNKSRKLLKSAFQKKDNNAIGQISHKMLTLMRMVSAQEIISILTDFEKGDISEEKRVTLFRLLEKKIAEAKDMRQMLDTMNN